MNTNEETKTHRGHQKPTRYIIYIIIYFTWVSSSQPHKLYTSKPSIYYQAPSLLRIIVFTTNPRISYEASNLLTNHAFTTKPSWLRNLAFTTYPRIYLAASYLLPILVLSPKHRIYYQAFDLLPSLIFTTKPLWRTCCVATKWWIQKDR